MEIVSNDTVASHENIFLRRVRVSNLLDKKREIRVFLHHDFRIYENKVGDTAFYDPESLALIHYKKHRYFLINTEPHFDNFSTGRKAFRDQEGTWRDAEDGDLSRRRDNRRLGRFDDAASVFELRSGKTLSSFFTGSAPETSHEEVMRAQSSRSGRTTAEFSRLHGKLLARVGK